MSSLTVTDVFNSKKKIEQIGGVIYGQSVLKFFVVGSFKGNYAPGLFEPLKIGTTANIGKEWSFLINNDYND